MKVDVSRAEDTERQIRMYLADIQIVLSRNSSGESTKSRILVGLREIVESPEVREALSSE